MLSARVRVPLSLEGTLPLNTRKLLNDLLTAFGAQGVSFACSVVMTLLVPKILGIEEFGYWQLFVFYTSYVSFFQLGLNDGIYLQHGGEGRDEIDKSLVRSEFEMGVGYQLVIALIIAAYGIFCGEDVGRTFVIISSSLFLVISNASYYISFVFQAMNETKIASYSTIVNRGLYLVFLLVCVFARVDDFRIYVLFYLFAQTISLAYLLLNAKEFAQARLLNLRQAAFETFASMKIGIVLTVANVSGMLIMGMCRVVIDAIWGIEAFGQVSLSLSIVNFALTFISQAAMVLFPAMRSAGTEKARDYYVYLRDGLGAILPFAVLLYAPLRALVGLWLPQYADGLSYLAFLFPVCLFEVQTNLTIVTFLKVRCDTRALLMINGAALLCALVAQTFAVFMFDSPVMSVLASLFGVAMRYAIGTVYLGRVYKNRNPKMMLCMFAESLLFIASAYNLSLVWGFTCCIGIFGAHLAVCHNELERVFSRIRRLKDE